MLKITTPRCHEVNKIFKYIQDSIANGSATKPALKYEVHKQLLDLFDQMLDANQFNNQMLLKLLSDSSSLSEFDVNMTFISDKLQAVSDKLFVSSNTNLSIVDETKATITADTKFVDQNTSLLDTVTSKSIGLVTLTNQNMESLNEIAALKQTVFENSKIMEDKISSLEQMASKVNEIVSGVQGIAEQTNLLALNASIEAARAGEHGRGFAVVAEEIRKLAEDTKLKLQDMQGFTSSIRKATAEGITSVLTTITSIDEMGQKIDKVNHNFENSVTDLNATVNDIKEISSAMQSLNESSQKTTTAIRSVASESQNISTMALDISTESKNVSSYSNTIGDIDLSLSKNVKALIANLNRGTKPITNKDFILVVEKAINSHAAWINKLKGIVENNKPVPIQQDGRKCAFGHFYHSITMEHPTLKPIWDSIDPIHIELHKSSSYIIDAIKKEDFQKSQQVFLEAEKMSKEILSKLHEILELAKHIDTKDERVFTSELCNYLNCSCCNSK